MLRDLMTVVVGACALGGCQSAPAAAKTHEAGAYCSTKTPEIVAWNGEEPPHATAGQVWVLFPPAQQAPSWQVVLIDTTSAQVTWAAHVTDEAYDKFIPHISREALAGPTIPPPPPCRDDFRCSAAYAIRIAAAMKLAAVDAAACGPQ